MRYPTRVEENPSRKDFRAVADIIKNLPVDDVTRHTIAVEFARLYAGQNPRFKRDLFLEASGVDPNAHASGLRTRFQGNPHHRRGRGERKYPGATYHVEVWEERDRLHIALWRKWKDEDDIVADWWDDDARQMFEDGFFESGRKLEGSVIAYAKDIGIIS